ncbi:MAG: TlpA family protein disulfide reductase [Desulfovibrionaceae bacterium]|nr:TlpA family protein disulfide reductase [Desulfovibrionaceae bacterium]
MPRRIVPALLAVALLACAAATAAAGEPFPDLRLPAPGTEAAARLGINRPDQPFSLSEIRAGLVIINVYNYFCGPCHAETPKLKELDREINERGLSDRVALLAIAAGDTAQMVERFKQARTPCFPIFPDPDYVLHRALGNVPVPYFFVVRPGPSPRLIHAQEGEFPQTPAGFLDLILKKNSAF